jgi:hypothetical protein
MNTAQELKVERTALEVAKELIKLKALLDSNKPLYDLQEKLTLELKDLLKGEEVLVEEEMMVITPTGPAFTAPQTVKIVDNFESKNTVFRAAAVKRFEMSTETVIERQQRLEKEAKKAAKAALKA